MYEITRLYIEFCRQCSGGIVIIENKWTAGMVLNNLKYICWRNGPEQFEFIDTVNGPELVELW